MASKTDCWRIRRRCRFDPATVQCKGGAQENCLTAPQVEAARKIYAGARNPRTGKQVFPGMAPGSELVWPALAGREPFGIPVSHFQHVVFNNPGWDFLTLDFDKDVALADKLDKDLIGATDPNLKEFFAHGGKLIVYHGWNDQLITPLNSIDYYNSVAEKLGGAAKIDGSFRLFMAPGMNHCSGGDGPSRFDTVSALEQWVEQGKAPERMVASHVAAGNQVDRSRPALPIPAGGAVHRDGEHRRRREFHLRAGKIESGADWQSARRLATAAVACNRVGRS